MFTFVAKPVEVEAWQYFRAVGTETAAIPTWAIKLALDKIILSNNNMDRILIGIVWHELADGDWIVKDGSAFQKYSNTEFNRLYQPKV